MGGRHGLPLRLYPDRGSHYFPTAVAGGKVDRSHLTQIGRALAHLGVEQIAAYSPLARGRPERVFHTLQDRLTQDRLTKELALAAIATIEAANAFIRDVYVPARNARFAVEAEQEGAAFVAIPGVDLGEILCVQEERRAGNDNCVTFNRLKLQIPKARCARTSSRRGSRSGKSMTEAMRSFMGQDVWGDRTKWGPAPSRKRSPKSALHDAYGNVDKANTCLQPSAGHSIKLRLTEPLASFAHRRTEPEEADI